MRRMIPEKLERYLDTLSRKEEFLSRITVVGNAGINGFGIVVDSDGLTYCTISGQVDLDGTGDGAIITVSNIPERLVSAGKYPATNDQGTAEYVNVSITNTTALVTFNEGVEDRVIYFSILLTKKEVSV